MALRSRFGGPSYSALATGQVTVTASAAAVGSQSGIGLLWLTAFATNAGVVYYGPAGVTTGTGVPLAAGERRLISVESLASVYVVGTASDKVAWEAYS